MCAVRRKVAVSFASAVGRCSSWSRPLDVISCNDVFHRSSTWLVMRRTSPCRTTITTASSLDKPTQARPSLRPYWPKLVRSYFSDFGAPLFQSHERTGLVCVDIDGLSRVLASGMWRHTFWWKVCNIFEGRAPSAGSELATPLLPPIGSS
jgi:hypothetical protein